MTNRDPVSSPEYVYIYILKINQYPIEYTKTAMQLSTEKLTTKQVIQSTYQSSGALGFYRGLPSMVYFAAPKAAIRFSGFEACSGLLMDENGNDIYKLGKAKGFIAGLGAGTLEAIFVTTPQETIKVRLINDAFRTDGPPKYKSFFHGVKTIVGEQGFVGIYKGLAPTIIKVSTVSNNVEIKRLELLLRQSFFSHSINDMDVHFCRCPKIISGPSDKIRCIQFHSC